MTAPFALAARRIFDGNRFHENAALVIRDGRAEGIAALTDLPPSLRRVEAGGETICPGFVDWQVNGGGGVLFNETPTAEATRAIARAHVAFGTTTLLPTVITDAREVAEAAAEAVAEAIREAIPGVAGMHFEDPHLSVEKKGVHDSRFIRPLEPSDLDRMTRPGLGKVVATLAPENATMADISALSGAGVLVSIGHTNADYALARQAFAAGARAVTHLFNAMAPLHHRNPGLVGAAMEDPRIWCGLIADGHHLHPAVLRMVFGSFDSNRLTLVTDAMSSVGSEKDELQLNGRTVRRDNGRLTTADGTLAGSDLNMMSAVRFSIDKCGVPVGTALQMASRNPARMLGLTDRGHFHEGARADVLVLTETLELASVWLGGEEQVLSGSDRGRSSG